MTNGKRDLEWLDAAVVLFAMAIIAFIVGALMFKTIPDNQLAVVSALGSGLMGTILGAYAGFRWATSKQASQTIADLAKSQGQAEGKAPQPVTVVNTADAPVQVEETHP